MNEEIYCNILRNNSKELIIQDGATLLDIGLNIRNGVISLSLLPLIALYCRSAKEFLDIVDSESQVEQEIKDIRNGLKIFTGRYAKSKSMALESDDHQNKVFQNMLRFKFTKNLNIHYNLGVYFTREGKIVFNTQLMDYYLSIPSKKPSELINAHAFKIGEKLGKEVADILFSYLCLDYNKMSTHHYNPVPQFGYIDFNTNKHNKFFNNSFSKEMNLIILHILSSIGFVNNVLLPTFREGNTWLIRVIYITVHNTWHALQKLKRHLEGTRKVERIDFDIGLLKGTQLLSTSFRNCMMHYDLIDKSNQPVISQKFYNPEIPLYGLIESCYDGLSYTEFYSKLKDFAKSIETHLLSFFTVDKKSICWDWS